MRDINFNTLIINLIVKSIINSNPNDFLNSNYIIWRYKTEVV